MKETPDSTELASVYMPAALEGLAHFPVDAGEIKLVTQSENVTFRVTDDDNRYVFRLHRPGYNSLDELNSERAWTATLNEAGIPAPDSILARDGNHFVQVTIPATGEQCYAGMTRWLDGIPLGEHLDTPSGSSQRTRLFGRLGELAAAMHNQAANWPLPPGFTRPRLDAEGLLGEMPRWGRFWEHAALSAAEQKLLGKSRNELCDVLADYGETPDRFSLIHADMNADNTIYNDGRLAIIDFDDSAFGWHLYDLAAILIDETQAPDFQAIRSALISGYRSGRPIADADVEWLDRFLLIRGLVTIGWFHQRPEHSDSELFHRLKHWVLETCDAGSESR